MRVERIPNHPARTPGRLFPILLTLALGAGLAPACAGSDGKSDPAPVTCPAPQFENPGTYTMQTLVYDTVGGVGLEADVYTPSQPGPHPGMVTIHGGGWIMNDRTLVHRVAEYYAQHGFVVMNVEYRLIQAPDVMMGDLGRDVVCAVRWLKAHSEDYGMTRECVGLLGESAGGHLTALAALADDRPEFMAGCEEAGATDGKVWYAMPYYGVFDFDLMLQDMHGDPSFLSIFFRPTDSVADYSPITLTERRLSVDFFVTAGTGDTLVDPQQSIRFEQALEASGHNAIFVPVEGAPHGYVAGGFDGPFNAVAQPHAEAFLVESLARTK